MSGAKCPSLVKYRVWAARQYSSERSPSPSSNAKASSTSLNRRFVSSIVFRTAFGLPRPSKTTIDFPTSAERRPWLSAQQVARFVPDKTKARSSSANCGLSPNENVSRFCQFLSLSIVPLLRLTRSQYAPGRAGFQSPLIQGGQRNPLREFAFAGPGETHLLSAGFHRIALMRGYQEEIFAAA